MPFRRPTTTPTPDEIFDEWVHQLKHSELLVLLYIVRRTFGFRDRYGEVKDGDTISLRQFHEGIVTKGGRRLDHGCGVRNKTSITQALKRLEELGLIRVQRSESEDKGNETTWYALAFQDAAADRRGRGAPIDEERDCRQADVAARDGLDSPDDVDNVAPLEGGYAKRTRGGTQNVLGGYATRTGGGAHSVLGGVRTAHPQQTVDTTNSRRQTVISNRKPLRTRTRAGPPLDSNDSIGALVDSDVVVPGHRETVVDQRVAMLSAEFGDDAPRASQTRVANVRREADLDDDALLTLLNEAAAITQSQAGAIVKRGRDGRAVGMPYLLRTLHNLAHPEQPGREGALVPGHNRTVAPLAEGKGRGGGERDEPDEPDEPDEVWRAALGELRTVLTPENYDAWLATTHVVARTDDLLLIGAPKSIQREWLERRLHRLVVDALVRTGHGHLGVEYVVAARAGSGDTDTGDGGGDDRAIDG